jgi:hypothetical protein
MSPITPLLKNNFNQGIISQKRSKNFSVLIQLLRSGLKALLTFFWLSPKEAKSHGLRFASGNSIK